MFSNIPMPKLPSHYLEGIGQDVSGIWQKIRDQQLKKIADEQMNQYRMQELERQKLSNQMLNQYRQGELGLKQQELGLTKESQPLKLDLLKAQIEAQKALSESRKSAGTSGDKVLDRQIKLLDEKEKRKEAKSIKETMDILVPHMRTISNLLDILERKPNLTGRGTQFAKFIGATKDPDVGTFSSGSLSLQTKLAKELSNRGGYGVSRIVAANKPDISNAPEFNKGALQDLKSKSIYPMIDMKNAYEKSGEKFPYKISDFFKNVIVKTPDNKLIKLKTDGALELIKDHPDHQIVG